MDVEVHNKGAGIVEKRMLAEQSPSNVQGKTLTGRLHIVCKKVNVSNDQEMAQSERNSYSKTQSGKIN